MKDEVRSRREQDHQDEGRLEEGKVNTLGITGGILNRSIIQSSWDNNAKVNAKVIGKCAFRWIPGWSCGYACRLLRRYTVLNEVGLNE